MTTFHVGEQVLIKSPLTYCKHGLNSKMLAMAGAVVTIAAAYSDYDYRIEEDDWAWYWCINCFEPIEQVPEHDINLEGLL